jgi:hypothetical protein
MKIHVYSNLNLRYFEFADPIDEQIPDCDLIVVAGSISDNAKRSLLFQETISVISKKPLVVNYSLTEFAKGDFYQDVVEATAVRYQMKTDVKCYYHFNDCINISDPAVNVLTVTGWPHILTDEDLNLSPLGRYLIRVKFARIYNEKNELIAQVDHSPVSKDVINELHQVEHTRISNWLGTTSTAPRLLVVGSNAREILAGFDLTGVTVITTADEFTDCEFQGGRLYANPGSGAGARSNVLVI